MSDHQLVQLNSSYLEEGVPSSNKDTTQCITT